MYSIEHTYKVVEIVNHGQCTDVNLGYEKLNEIFKRSEGVVKTNPVLKTRDQCVIDIKENCKPLN